MDVSGLVCPPLKKTREEKSTKRRLEHVLRRIEHGDQLKKTQEEQSTLSSGMTEEERERRRREMDRVWLKFTYQRPPQHGGGERQFRASDPKLLDPKPQTLNPKR